MPPRHPTGELDELSRMIGELSAYVHEGRHGVNNLSTKFDALALDIARRVETMKAELSIRLAELERRLAAVEGIQQRETGEKSVIKWILQSPLVGWIVAAAMFIAAVWSRDVPR